MIKIFFSYSHRDATLRDELEVHLAPLKREGVVSTWHDRKIDAGSDFAGEISANLEDAEVILLLISPYFLASDYCHDIEMRRALERHAAGEARVIPVILESCDWKNSPFGHLVALPTDGKPVVKHSSYHDAFLQVALEIRKLTGSKREFVQPAKVERSPSVVPIGSDRSSNLRVARELTDRDKDAFISQAFEYIANYFENSLAELVRRYPELEQSFRRIDANAFTSAIYVDGRKESTCSIVMGGSFGDIAFSFDDQASRSSCNEWLSVVYDGYVISLEPGGMQHHHYVGAGPLTMEGAAEYFWGMLIEPLQRER